MSSKTYEESGCALDLDSLTMILTRTNRMLYNLGEVLPSEKVTMQDSSTSPYLPTTLLCEVSLTSNPKLVNLFTYLHDRLQASLLSCAQQR